MGETELRDATYWAEIWSSIEHWAFLGVVVALAIEFAAMKFAAPHKQKLEAAREQLLAELRRDSAVANQRAEEERLARLKIEERLAWRVLSPEQQARIAGRMAPFSGQQFTVLTYRDDLEASNLGALLRQSLESAGWQFRESQPLEWLDSGVSIELAEANTQNLSPVAAELVRAINAEGVVTKQVNTPKYDQHPTLLFVVVGKKPPSGLELPGRGLQ